jgi:hypothetical protein
MLRTSQLHITHVRVPRQRALPRSLGLSTALLAMPLLGVAGAISMYYGTGTHDLWYALGLGLIAAAVVGFQRLRSRLIVRYTEHHLLLGMPAHQARAQAERDFDRLLVDHYRPETKNASSEPPALG